MIQQINSQSSLSTHERILAAVCRLYSLAVAAVIVFSICILFASYVRPAALQGNELLLERAETVVASSTLLCAFIGSLIWIICATCNYTVPARIVQLTFTAYVLSGLSLVLFPVVVAS